MIDAKYTNSNKCALIRSEACAHLVSSSSPDMISFTNNFPSDRKFSSCATCQRWCIEPMAGVWSIGYGGAIYRSRLPCPYQTTAGTGPMATAPTEMPESRFVLHLYRTLSKTLSTAQRRGSCCFVNSSKAERSPSSICFQTASIRILRSRPVSRFFLLFFCRSPERHLLTCLLISLQPPNAL